MDSDRPVGFGPGRIPWSSIIRYCDRRQLDEDQEEAMIHHFREMDGVYIGHVQEASKRG